MLLQVNVTALPQLPSLPQVDPVNLLNLILITLTLIFAYYAYRTQHLSTDILDVSASDGAMEFLVKNMSHTSHVVLRIKLRALLPGEAEPRDLREFSLDPDASKLDYLYPERAGTAKRPGLPYRVELGPLDFTRFRTVPPLYVVRPSTTPGAVQWHDGGPIEVHLYDPVGKFEDLEEVRAHFQDGLEREIERIVEEQEDVDELEPPLPPYLIPSTVDKIALEVHQTGEEYVMARRNDEWHIASKRRRKVNIDGNEYSLGRLEVTHLNLWYWLRYDLPWYLIDP